MNEGTIISMGNELKKLKLDLHTHIWEASSFEKPSVETAYKVINQCKKIGIDGIAITDHDHAHPDLLKITFEYYEIFNKHFPNEILVFPGREIELHMKHDYFQTYEVGEFLLPNGQLFRNYCHPGHPSQQIEIYHIQSIEINNAIHNWHINKNQVRELADKHNLFLTEVSDAHEIDDIGKNFIEINLDDLLSSGINLNETNIQGWENHRSI